MSAPEARRIAIVGAGITGLAAAHRLIEPHFGTTPRVIPDVVLFEAAGRAGGIVRSERAGGFVFEHGPDSFVTDKPEALALCERLGLLHEVIEMRPQYRRSFVVHQGKLVPTPDGFQLLAPAKLGPTLRSPLLTPLGKLRLAMEPFVPARVDGQDESLGSFVRRRLGHEVLERLAQPMVAGIYGADPEQLSLAATFPRFLRMEAEHGSVLKGLRVANRVGARGADAASGARYALFASLRKGMQTLTDRLISRLPYGALRLSTPVRAIGQTEGERPGWTVDTERGIERFDAVLLAIPAKAAAPLVDALDPKLAAGLREIRYGTSINATMAWPASDIAHRLDGAGFVVPAIEQMQLLGCSFLHRKFEDRAPEGQALLRIFFDERALGLDETRVTVAALDALKPLLGVQKPPRLTRVVRHPQAMPHYQVGHLERVAALRKQAGEWLGLVLAGSSYDGVGLPDCVRSGEQAAEQLGAVYKSPS